MLGSICKAALSRARDLSLAPCARHAKAFAPSRAHVDERLWLCVESTSESVELTQSRERVDALGA